MSRVWVLSSLVLVVSIVGCSRVPPDRNAPALRVASKKAKPDKSKEESKTSEAESKEETDGNLFEFDALSGDVETLCSRACEHWIDLRFSDTPPTQGLQGKSRQYLENVIFRSQAAQQVECQEKCIENGDRMRIRCILLTTRLERLSRCLE